MNEMKKTEDLKFNFRDKVKDIITGFEGTITAKIQYIFGCTQYQVTPPSKDGEQKKADWIDESQLELVEASNHKETKKKEGGIRPKP